jgi:hypothetical protein
LVAELGELSEMHVLQPEVHIVAEFKFALFYVKVVVALDKLGVGVENSFDVIARHEF